MIKAIFFDNGGVLCQEGFTLGIKKYEAEFNIPEGEFYKILHDHQGWKDFTLGLISQDEYLKICRGRSGSYPFDDQRFLELIDQSTLPNFELIEYIKKLTLNFKIGIISNNPKEMFERIILKIGLSDTVKYKIISCYTHVRKPDKRAFQLALTQVGIKAEESIYVDDRPDRVEGARELGMRILIYQNNFQQFKEDLEKVIKNN